MRRRNKAGHKAVKVRRQKALTRRDAPKATRRSRAAAADLEDLLERRTHELNEAREQQAATLEVLKVISSSPGDLSRVFDAILERATRLCEATHGHVWRFDGEQLHVVAVRGDPQFVEWLRQHGTVRPIAGSAADRIVQGARFDHMADRREEDAYRDNQIFRGLVDTGGDYPNAQVLVAFDDKRILTYIWDSSAPKGTVQSASNIPLVHIYAVVCQSGTGEANKWLTESRNVAADYERAYGRTAPRVRGLRLQINSQHTGTTAESYFGEVAFRSMLQ